MVINPERHSIPLSGAQNARDLGGYPTTEKSTTPKSTTQKGVFIRSDSLHNLTEEDICLLKSLGVTMQIDLRSVGEVSRNPSKLSEVAGITYHNIGFLDNIYSSGFSHLPKSMAEMYCGLLDNYREKYATLFRLFLSNSGNCIFNCTAGKDRTGVVAMLLLSLAEVVEKAIVADYAISQSNLASAIEMHKQQMQLAGYHLPGYIFSSAPLEMSVTLRYLRDQYNGAKGYLRICGLTDGEIEQIRKRLSGRHP